MRADPNFLPRRQPLHDLPIPRGEVSPVTPADTSVDAGACDANVHDHFLGIVVAGQYRRANSRAPFIYNPSTCRRGWN